MKIWMIVVVLGLLAVAGFAVVDAFVSEPVKEDLPTCGGGCNAEQSCGNPSCGAKVSKSCGCGGS